MAKPQNLDNERAPEFESIALAVLTETLAITPAEDVHIELLRSVFHQCRP